ncbi:LysR family transcriptional regulator [Cochlodiniinecator piscidefendens]|uniref:LysR family transcriptional regulator n=1 Tax=Cochlodiniinecator piscidefendens TaxID=2715756 RepID=UPI00140CEF68|nr:LysR family transcriptional regulator [Cochlodiniinecator piscidefendens]
MAVPSFSKADIHLMHVFSTVVEAKGFSNAQIILNVSASTISRQIADLETRLGMRLCYRGRRGFRLTDKGAIVYSAARTLFSALDQFGETVNETRGKLVGKLALAVIDNWVLNDNALIHNALSEFVQAAPDVSIELHSLAPDDIETAVQDGYVSLGIGVFHNHKPGLLYEELGQEKIGLYVGRGNPLFDVHRGDRADKLLKQANFAKRAYLNEERVAPISQGITSNAVAHQIEGIAMLILTGKYVGYLPQSLANVWLQRGQMRSVCNGKHDLGSEIKLVRKRGEDPNLVVSTFMDCLRAQN